MSCWVFMQGKSRGTMNSLAIASLLLSLTHWTGIGCSGSGETVFGTLGESVVLPCSTFGRNATPSFTRWTKDGEVLLLVRNHTSTPAAEQRLVLLDNGSLSIHEIALSDGGSYVCDDPSQDNNTQSSIALQVVSGPDDVTVDVTASSTLSNGTRVAFRGSTPVLNCSAPAYPARNLSWGFQASSGGSGNASAPLGWRVGAWLALSLRDVQPGSQGTYTCLAQDIVTSQRTARGRGVELLVYYVPDTHPDCEWSVEADPSHVLFTCSWPGAYPAPTLLWGEEPDDQGAGPTEGAEPGLATLRMNRTLLWEGQTLRCGARHSALRPGEQRSCSVTLKSPYPKGDPLVSVLEGSDVTLSCTEESSVPPANTTWLRMALGGQGGVVSPGPRHRLALQGPVLTLTILNATRLDQGAYFCRSENPLAVRELEVYLTVKTSSAYTGAFIGIFLAVLIVGSGVVVAKTLYSSRDRICLGHGFGRVQEEPGAVLSLVESDDDDDLFRGAVPRLPPLPNGLNNNNNNTTLVQIHRMPSSDHDDTDFVDQDPGQQENTDPLNLVTF